MKKIIKTVFAVVSVCLAAVPSALPATVTLLPSGDSSVAWSRTGAGANWACVTANDGDTSYVYTSSYTATDRYNLADLPMATGTVSAVRAYAWSRKSGTTFTLAMWLGIRSSGADYYGTIANTATSYTLYGGPSASCEWLTNPAGGGWTVGAVNGLIGYVRHQQNNVRQLRITQYYLEVDVTTPPPTATPTPVGFKTPSPTSTPCTILVAADFDSGSDGFGYADDRFRNTGQPAYESGSWTAASGYSGGGIMVSLGDVDNNTINGMSGGWSTAFNLAVNREVTIDLYYRLIFAANYEADEYGDAMLAVDGVYYGTGGNDYLHRFYGDGNGGPDMDSGWQSVSLGGSFSSGTHTLTVGGYNNKKTYADEWTDIYFDGIALTVCYPTVTPVPTATPTPTPEGYKTPPPSPVPSATPPPRQIFGIPSGYSEYYIPGSEEQMWTVYTHNQSTSMVQASGMHAVISVVANLDGTVVYYDHWENGYGFNPQSASTTADVVYYAAQGEVITFESQSIPVYPRGTGIYWDGMDRIYVAGGPATVTRMSWPQSVGTRYADACEVYPVKVLQTEWTIPVGENLADPPTSYTDFTQTFVMVQSVADGNRVEINDPWTAGTEVSVALNRGQVTQLLHANAGTFVSASAPVQVQMMVGNSWAPSQAWESRWYTDVPNSMWDKEYYCPVGGSTMASDWGGQTYYIQPDLFLHNFNDFTISVSFQDQSGSGSFTIFSNSTKSYRDGAGRYIPVGSGVYLNSDFKFWGVGAYDTEFMGWDWGFSLVPGYALSREYVLGWARGTSEQNPTANGNPLWITPTRDATVVYIDFSPVDGVPDEIHTLNRLESLKVFDPDNDNTGTRVWSTEPIACAWGEDADTAGRSDPYLDLGYTCVPVFLDWIDPVLVVEKSVLPSGVPFGVEETAWFTMTVFTEDYSVDEVVVWDWMPYGWNYVTGTTTITFNDWSVSTGDPLWDSASDPETLYWGVERDLGPYEFMTVYFQAVTDENIVEGLHRNETKSQGTRDGGLQIFSPIAYAYVSNYSYVLRKTTQTSFVEQSSLARFSIRLDNGPGGEKTNVRIADSLPAGFTFLTAAVSWNDATRVSFSEPTVGAQWLDWGSWTIYTGGDIAITLDTWVASDCAPGKYYNTAFAVSSESPRISNDDTITVLSPNGRCFDVAYSALTSAETSSTSLVTAGLSAEADLLVPGAIAVFCSFASETVAGATTGTWDLRMDGTASSQSIRRYLGPEGAGMGACLGIFPGLGTGTHSVRLRHATSDAGAAVRTREANLVVLPLTSEDGQVTLNHGLATIGSGGVTTGSAAWAAVTGLSASVTNDVRCRIFAAAVVNSASASGGSKTASYSLTVDGAEVGVPVSRELSGTNDLGIVTLVGLSDLVLAGPHTVAVRHRTDSGTVTASNGTLIAFSLGDDGGGHEAAIGGRQASFTSPTGTELNALTDVSWSANTLYVGEGDQILAAASFSVEHGAESGFRTALHDLTVDAAPVTQTGITELSGTNDRSPVGLFGMTDPLTAGSYTGYLRHAVASPEILTDDATFVLLGVCCEQDPTAVKLVEFTAEGYDRAVAVRWETGAELDSLGFYVLRSESPSGPFRRLNSSIVFSRGGAAGARYLLLDRSVENGVEYHYRLEEFGLDGEISLYGPVSAVPSAAGDFAFDPADYVSVTEVAAVPAPGPIAPATPPPVPAVTAPPPATPFATPAASPVPTPGCRLRVIDGGDYDGDGTSDIAVFRSDCGLWAVRNITRLYFGGAGDIPVPGDYDGDGADDIGIFRCDSGLWALRNHSRLYFGRDGDIPVAGDYAGDGWTAPAVFRPRIGLWAIYGLTRVYFGGEGDLPVPADYTGEGRSEIAVFRPAAGLWAIRGTSRFYFGTGPDIPVPGDYSGDGTGVPAVFRPANGLWAVRGWSRFYFGAAGDLPVPLHGESYRQLVPGIFRPRSGLWAVRDVTRAYFGSGKDLPVTR